MIMSNTMLIGLGIVAVGALAGLIGTLVDTKNSAGLKWFLVLVILGAGAAGVFTEYQREDFAKSEQKRSEEALRMAKESGRLAGEEMVKNELFRQKSVDDKEKLKADRIQHVEMIQTLADELIVLSDKVAEIEAAAAKARKTDIAEAGVLARLEISKKLLDMAKTNQWLGVLELTKMETSIASEEPLKPKELKLLQVKLKENLAKSPIEEENP
jgi:hypothetical protein